MVNYAYLGLEGFWNFYSSVELTFISWRGRSFLVGKILINTCILRDPFLVETLLIRVNCGVQDISLCRYPWGSSKAMLDPSASPPHQALNPSFGFPLAYRGACRVTLWGRHVWCRRPKSSVSFREAYGYMGAINPFLAMLWGY